MEDFKDGRSPYEVLELPKGPDSTPDEIKKAYRRLAALKHPDKNKDNPKAHEEFIELKLAYEALSNKETRGALDDFLKAKAAREERHAAQDSKRRKMREDLDRRERQAATGVSEEAAARAALQKELDKLKQRLAAEQRSAAEAAAAAAAAQRASADAAAAAAAGADAKAREQLARTLKVSWDAGAGEYGSQQLRDALGAHGEVEDVVLRERKKKRKGSALVVMATREQALRAAQSVCGSLSNPLLVVPFNKIAPDEEADDLAGPSTMPAAAPAEPAAAVPLFGAAAAASQPAPRPMQPLFAAGAGAAGGPAFPAAAAAAASSAGSGPSSYQPPAATGSRPATPPAPLFPSAAPGAAAGQSACFPSSAAAYPVSGAGASSIPSGSGRGGAAFGAAPSSFPGAVSSFPSFASAPGGAGSGAGGAEGAILEKMRRAAEREKLLAELRQQDG